MDVGNPVWVLTPDAVPFAWQPPSLPAISELRAESCAASTDTTFRSRRTVSPRRNIPPPIRIDAHREPTALFDDTLTTSPTPTASDTGLSQQTLLVAPKAMCIGPPVTALSIPGSAQYFNLASGPPIAYEIAQVPDTEYSFVENKEDEPVSDDPPSARAGNLSTESRRRTFLEW